MESSAEVVLVTGSSRGVGRAVAKGLIERGHTVVLMGRDEARLDATARELGAKLAFAGDVSEPGVMAQIVEQVREQFGHLDVLVNNAGIAGKPGPLVTQDPEAWWRVLEVNVRGPMLAMHACLPSMTAQGGGTIINVSTLASVSTPIPGMTAYPTSKAALTRLTETLAEEVRGSGVSVFNVSPGLVRTDMTRDEPLFSHLPDSAWTPVSAIAELVATLVENDFSALSGRFLHVRDDVNELLAEARRIEEERLHCLRIDGLS